MNRLLHVPRVGVVGRWFAVGLVFALISGCASTRMGLREDMAGPKYFQPANVQAEARMPAIVRRVVVLPICGGTLVSPESVAMLEEAFGTELQRQVRFEVVRFSREDCRRRFGAAEFSSSAVLPHDFLSDLGRDFGADAVLFIDLTTYRTYPPLTVGVRAKLATIEQTHLIWSFDEVFSAADPTVSNGVRHYYATSDLSGVPANVGLAALQSPSKFAAYVASATFHTLPPR